MTTDIGARYGRTPQRAKRSRMLAISAAVAVAAVVGAWVLWVGLFDSSATIETKDVGYVELTESSGTVRWQLTTLPGTKITCAVKAINDNHAVVGWRTLDIEPSEQATRALSAVVRVSEPAIGGSVHACWVTPTASAADAVLSNLP